MRFFIFSLILLFPFFAFAQTGNTDGSWINTPELCSDKFTLTGSSAVKTNTSQEYSLKNSSGTVLPYGEFAITSENGNISEIRTVERDKFSYSFPEAGIYKISVKLDATIHQCLGNISHEVHAFREEILYIGMERSDLQDASLNAVFREKSVLFQTHFSQNIKLDENPTLWTNLGNSDIIIFNTSDILGLFSDMEKLQRLKENNFAQKNVFIISDQSPNFLSKVLASSVAKLGIENLYLISEDQFSTLLSHWSYNDERGFTIGEKLSYEKKDFIFSLSTVLDYLVYSGISYQFFGFLLSLAVVALLLNIFKQVIGLDVFMIYYPVFLGIIFSQMGIIFTFAFIVIAFMAILLVRLISTKIQLLVNAKKAFLVSVYVLLIFLAIGLDNLFSLNIFRVSAFETVITIIAIFAILFVVEKLIDNVKIFSKSGILKSLARMPRRSSAVS